MNVVRHYLKHILSSKEQAHVKVFYIEKYLENEIVPDAEILLECSKYPVCINHFRYAVVSTFIGKDANEQIQALVRRVEYDDVAHPDPVILRLWLNLHDCLIRKER